MTVPNVSQEQMNTLPYIVAIDFDGTLCENAFPEIGAPNTAVIELVKAAQAKGVYFILWTCRNGQHLDNAIQWCQDNGLRFGSVNTNHPAAIEMFGGSDTRKVFANEYWDDKAVVFEFTQEETEECTGCGGFQQEYGAEPFCKTCPDKTHG